MRATRLLSFAVLAACASSGASSSAAPAQQTVEVRGPSSGVSLRMAPNDVSNTRTVPFAAEKVWLALPGVLDSLGLPVGTLEPAKHLIGNAGYKVRGRLKSVSLSRYIDCGSSGQIGPNADTYEIVLTVFAEVRPAEGGASTVVTTFESVGRPVNYAQEYSQCRSKGVFENRLIDILQARLQR